MSTIATTVYTTQEIALSDDTVLKLRPLPIAPMRKFMEAFDGLSEAKEDKEIFNVFTKMTIVILNALDKSRKYDTEYVEETVDIETMKYMFKVCGSVDLDATPKEIPNPEGAGAI